MDSSCRKLERYCEEPIFPTPPTQNLSAKKGCVRGFLQWRFILPQRNHPHTPNKIYLDF